MTDRDRLIELLKEADENTSKNLIMDYDDAITDNADYLLANDVVKVVRCKDCKHCKLQYPAKAKGEEAIEGYYCYLNREYVNPTHYCNYGELKECEG